MALDGTYEVHVFTGHGEKSDRFVLTTENGIIEGIYKSKEMGDLPFKDLKIECNLLSWHLVYGGPDGKEMKIPFSVTIQDNQVKGKLSMAGDTPFEITGEKIA